MTQSLTVNTSASFANELTPTVATLATMADLCVKILQHITAGEVRQVFPLSDELRSVRARLSDQLAKRLELLKDFKPSTNLELRQLEQLKLGVGIVGKFDQVHDQWVKVLDEPHEQDLAGASVEQWHVILEKRLARGWDRRRDLLVVYGEVTEELRTAIVERLQERLLVYQPEPSSHLHSLHEVIQVQGQVTKNKLNKAPFNDDTSVVQRVEDLKRFFPFNDPPLLLTEITAPNAPHVDDLTFFKEELQTLFLIANVSKNTVKAFGPRWFNQGMENIPAIARSQPLSDLNGHFSGLPMIMISPGPSLDKNINELKRAVGRAVLIAPAQSMKRLHKEGIYPDFIVVIDPQDLTADPLAFIDLTTIQSHQALIVGATCHPHVMNSPFSRRYVFGSTSNSAWLTGFFGDTHVNTSGTSVAVAATNIGIEWGCNPIILVGQDLSYVDGVQYAGKSLDKQKNDGIFEIDGYNGGKVKSPYGYKVAHYEFELIAERLSNLKPEIRLINATEGGAKIRGFTQQSLRNAIDDLTPENSRLFEKIELIREISSQFDFCQRSNSGRSNINLILRNIESLRESALSCRQICRKLQRKSTNQNFLKLGKEEQKMRKNLKSLGFLTLVVQDEIRRITQNLQSQSSLSSNLEMSLKFFDTIINACDLTERILRNKL